MKQYRVVSNGIRWRVQALVKKWYRRKAVWRFCGIDHPVCGFIISDYDSLEEAEKAMEYNIKIDTAREHGWQVVRRPK